MVTLAWMPPWLYSNFPLEFHKASTQSCHWQPVYDASFSINLHCVLMQRVSVLQATNNEPSTEEHSSEAKHVCHWASHEASWDGREVAEEGWFLCNSERGIEAWGASWNFYNRIKRTACTFSCCKSWSHIASPQKWPCSGASSFTISFILSHG